MKLLAMLSLFSFPLLLIFSGSLFAQRNSHLKQIQAFNCDFDDNIATTDAEIVVTNTKDNTEKFVSTADWALVKLQIGKEGPWKDYVLGPTGLRYFGDTGPDGDNLFAIQVERMIRENPNHFKAPSFNAFVSALSNPATRKHTSIITARLHSPTAIMKGLKVLLNHKLIPALPDIENIFPVAWPDFNPELKGATYAENKAKVMVYLLDRIQAQSVPSNATWVENRDGTGKEKLHLWGFSDDDFDNFSKARDVLTKEVATGRWPNIKIVLYFTGLNNPNENPRSLVIRSDGTTRPVMNTEATRMALPKKLCGRSLVEVVSSQ